jgi:hypothetical protein
MTIKEQALKIAQDFNISIRERVDMLLEMDANMYTNLGSDSNKTEKDEVKKNSKAIYRMIKGIDEQSGNLLLNHLDA